VISIAPDESITIWDRETGELLGAVAGRGDSLSAFEELCDKCKKSLGLRNFTTKARVPTPAPGLDATPGAPLADPMRDAAAREAAQKALAEAHEKALEDIIDNTELPEDAEPPLDLEGPEDVVPAAAAEGSAFIDLASIPDPDPALASIINPLMNRMLDKKKRLQARNELIAHGEKVVSVLKSRMHDPLMTIRWEVVNIIGEARFESGMPIVVDRVLNDRDYHVYWRAQWSMARAKSKDMILKTLRAHLDSRDPHVAWRAAVGLSFLKDPICLDAIHRGLAFADESRQWEAINALSAVSNSESSRALERVFRGSFVRGRQEAALALGKIGDADAVRILCATLDDGAAQVRWRAAKSLGDIGDRKALPALEKRLAGERDEFVREHLNKAIEKIGGGGR
jgi:HEAT repeat protein